MKIHTLKLFNSGQITLPKSWRDQFKTEHFLAKETKNGLLIQPLHKNDVVYFEDKEGVGLYCEEGLPVEDIVQKIKLIHGPD